MRRSRTRKGVGAALTLLAVTACGSTVQVPSTMAAGGDGLGSVPAAAGGADGLGASAGALGDPGNVTGPAAPGSGAPQPAAPGAPGAVTAPGAQQPRTTPSQPTSPRTLARGETATHISFGATYASGSGSANNALGLSGMDPGDARRYYDAVVDDVNRSGGVLGKKLKPVYFDTAGQGSADADQVAQSACTYFTQDKPVAAVVGRGHPVVRACTKQAGILALSTGFSTATSRTFAEFPNYVEISAVSLDRTAKVTVDGLAQSDYFAPNAKTGLITWDEPSYKYAVQAGWHPSLKRLGRMPLHTAYVAVPQSPNDVSSSSAAVSNAVLRFRQMGIDHVLIADGPAGMFEGTGLTLLFIRAASSQNYYPKYGMNQANSPQAGMDAGLWGAREMRGAKAITWIDYDEPDDKGTGSNPARQKCLAVMKSHGVTLDNGNARGAAMSACDHVYFLRTALSAGSAADLASALNGVARIGASYTSPIAYRTSFSRERRDGVAAARRSAFQDGCSCFRYTSAPYPVP